MPFQCTVNKIKELNKTIQIIELLQIDKLENIQLGKNLEVKSKITCQTNYKAQDLNSDNIAVKTNTVAT